MTLTKAQLVFDATTPANGDAVAAYLFASARLTSAAVAGNESLRTIAAIQDGAGTALTSTLLSGKQSLDVNVAGFSATDLHVDGTVADAVADADNPVKIGYHAYATLAAATAGNRVNAASDLFRRGYVNTSPNIGGLRTVATVGVAAVKVVTTPLAGREQLTLQNNGGKNMWIGFDNTVTADGGTTATGGMLLPAHGGTWSVPMGDNIDVWAISDTALQKLMVLEAA